MARTSISWKESDKAPHRATWEDCDSYTEQMLSLHLPEEHYMFLLASKLQAKAWNANELHFRPDEPQLNLVVPSGIREREVEPNAGGCARNAHRRGLTGREIVEDEVGPVKRSKS